MTDISYLGTINPGDIGQMGLTSDLEDAAFGRYYDSEPDIFDQAFYAKVRRDKLINDASVIVSGWDGEYNFEVRILPCGEEGELLCDDTFAVWFEDDPGVFADNPRSEMSFCSMGAMEVIEVLKKAISYEMYVSREEFIGYCQSEIEERLWWLQEKVDNSHLVRKYESSPNDVVEF